MALAPRKIATAVSSQEVSRTKVTFIQRDCRGFAGSFEKA
jgi:hypothetical protein